MNSTSIELDEGAIMSAFKHSKDAQEHRITFAYTDLTTGGARLHILSVPIESHLITFEENARMLQQVRSVQVPGTRFVQGTDGLWRLIGLDSSQPHIGDAGQLRH